MLRSAFLAGLTALLSTSAAAQPAWTQAERVDVALSNFRFAPKSLHLHAGQPAVLHLVNDASGSHNFTAPQFFAAATVRAEDRAAIVGGTIELAAHQSRDIALVPAAGKYGLRCTHALHAAFGMTGEIVVD